MKFLTPSQKIELRKVYDKDGGPKKRHEIINHPMTLLFNELEAVLENLKPVTAWQEPATGALMEKEDGN